MDNLRWFKSVLFDVRWSINVVGSMSAPSGRPCIRHSGCRSPLDASIRLALAIGISLSPLPVNIERKWSATRLLALLVGFRRNLRLAAWQSNHHWAVCLGNDGFAFVSTYRLSHIISQYIRKKQLTWTNLKINVIETIICCALKEVWHSIVPSECGIDTIG